MPSLPKAYLALDTDNIHFIFRKACQPFAPNLIMEIIRYHAQVVLAHAFVDSCDSATVRNEPELRQKIFQAGINIVDVPKIYVGNDIKKKDQVDATLERHVRWILENVPDIDTFILGTVDTDFIPMIADLRNRGKEVLLILPLSVDHLNGNGTIRAAASGIIEIYEIFEWSLATLANSILNPSRQTTEIQTILKSWRARGQGYLIELAHDVVETIQKLYWEVDLGDTKWYSFEPLAGQVYSIHFVQKGRYSRDHVKHLLTCLKDKTLLLSQIRPTDGGDTTEYILNKDHPFVKLALKKSWEEIYN